MQNLAHKLMTDELHYNIRTPVNRYKPYLREAKNITIS